MFDAVRELLEERIPREVQGLAAIVIVLGAGLTAGAWFTQRGHSQAIDALQVADSVHQAEGCHTWACAQILEIRRGQRVQIEAWDCWIRSGHNGSTPEACLSSSIMQDLLREEERQP